MTTSWMDRAACRGTDLDLWFPTGPSRAADDRAKAVCIGCPVRTDCAEAAFRTGDIDYGIRAGMTSAERQQARRRWTATGRVAPVRLASDDCETKKGVQAHRRRREVCARCEAWQERQEARARERSRHCGSRWGYQLHGKAGERACSACMEAERAYQRERHVRRKAARRSAA